MANAVYAKAKQSFLGQSPSVDMDSDNIKIELNDNGVDVPLPATDQFLSDLAAGARIALSSNLQSKAIPNGVFDADDITVTGVSGATIESINGYKDTGVVGTSPLIWYDDVATGLPFTPNGGDVTVQWDNGANRIFAL